MNGSGQGSATWLCCHLGAREHYAVPRALHAAGRLRTLYTDVWMRPGSGASLVAGVASQRLRERFHPDLADADVRAFTGAFIAHELAARTRREEGWPSHIARNQWFQAKVTRALQADAALDGAPGMVFAHSYSAREIFRAAKSANWTTVLGQIDPGPEHFRITEALSQRAPEFGAPPPSPPAVYFEAWRDECALADWILVNSEWSRSALEAAGVPAAKLRVMPLTYRPEADRPPAPERQYPASFSSSRPLRALFVGTASVAKGVADLLQAFELLRDQPIELDVVGDRSLVVPERLAGDKRVRWIGRVNRNAVMTEYQAHDVLLFPSHSDGFGMAQVEAQAWGLPIIASRNCGAVVRDGETGLILDEVSPAAIASALRTLLGEPQLLTRFAAASAASRPAGLAQLADVLLELPAA